MLTQPMLNKKTLRVSDLTETPQKFEGSLDTLEDPFNRLRLGQGFFNFHGKIRKLGDYVKIEGIYNSKVTTECDICLDEFDFELSGTVDLILRQEEEISEDELSEFNLNDSDTDYFQDDTVKPANYFRSQFFLDCPEIFRCEENCPGLCSKCGEKKDGRCLCPVVNSDNPFAKLKISP